MRALTRDEIVLELSPKSATFGRARAQTHTSVTAPSLSVSDHTSHRYLPRPQRVGSRDSSSQRRHARATTFYNFESFGSLRPGQDWIRLFHKRYSGLVVHVTVCGFAFYFFSYGYGRLIAEYLKANDEAQVQAAHYVLVWPKALSLSAALSNGVMACY